MQQENSFENTDQQPTPNAVALGEKKETNGSNNLTQPQAGYSRSYNRSGDRGYDRTGAGGQGTRNPQNSSSSSHQSNRSQSDYQGRSGHRGNSRGLRTGLKRDGRSRGASSSDRRQNRREKEAEVQQLDNKVIDVRRVTRVVKGGKRMRFSALVVVGDRNGKVGFAIKKGLDYQDAVAKATKKATSNLIKVELNSDFSLKNIVQMKYKACEIYLKPAKQGTGLIAGGYVRPVLELAGVQNVYSKVIRSRNKIAGVQAVFEALKDYKKDVEVK
jgi:small subunit ribosomal protein S5